MKIIEIHGESCLSEVVVGESLKNLNHYVPEKRAVIITDHNVSRHYRDLFPPGWQVVEIGTGETVKTLDTVQHIYDRLLELEIDRSCFIVGVGGGIVCDITGFVASTYMRGLPFGFVATTLLSQVDAGVGGKNGVNFRGYKNMVGVFNQPAFVICDINLLATLPAEELSCGFAEVIKHAAIGDAQYFRFLEENAEAALALDPVVMERVVYDSVVVKSGIVGRDEFEKGERRKLNFGHTLAHALEKTMGLPHGEAVGIGMVAAADLSVSRGFPEADARRIEALLRRFRLPVRPGVGECDPKHIDGLKEALGKDKKRAGKGIHFVLLKALGEAVVEEIPFEPLEELVDDLCMHC